MNAAGKFIEALSEYLKCYLSNNSNNDVILVNDSLLTINSVDVCRILAESALHACESDCMEYDQDEETYYFMSDLGNKFQLKIYLGFTGNDKAVTIITFL